MSTKVVKLNQAEQMMAYLEIDKDGKRILVRFADGKEGWVSVNDIKELSPEKSLDLGKVELPSPYELEIGTREGDTIAIPWDFTRHYCDPEYKKRELEQKDEGRSVIGNRIASIREGRGMTQEELAESANIGRVTISRLENGEQSPRYQTLKKLAEALGVDTTQLLTKK